MMGYDVAVPALPVDKIASDQPLRAAILAWVASTGSVVPPAELAAQLARADALPLDVQRDVALLLLSAIEASALQRAALAHLSPAQLQWISEHPELAAQLAEGIDTPDTRMLAYFAGQVDVGKSLEASLLLLAAVEATRGSFEAREASAALDALELGELDATTKAVLTLLLTADDAMGDSDKVRLAAKLVAAGAGIPLPAPVPDVAFADALAALTAATGQVAAPADITSAVARATALPDDLESALARLLLAQARAVQAADPAHLTPTSQQQALAVVLLASADALPVLEKYSLFWRDAPEALRMGEWEPNARFAWAAHHAALFATTRGGLVELARSAALETGHPIDTIPAIPERSFADAYAAMLATSGMSASAAQLADITAAGERLDPAVRDAATIMMSGAAESARLHHLAFADLTRAERAELVAMRDIDVLYAKPSLTEAELARLARGAALAARVDDDALWQSAAVSALAMREAQATLEGAGAFSALGADATPVETGFLSFLKRLLPFGMARAQDEDCAIAPLVDTCGDDVLLRISWLDPVPAESNAASNMPGYADDSFGTGTYTCDERECTIHQYSVDPNVEFNDGHRHDSTGGEATTDMIVITGLAGSRHEPPQALRLVCPAIQVTVNNTTFVQPTPRHAECRYETVARYGAPTITLDLGGDDTYIGAVAMVHVNATIPVSLHLDVAGSDTYGDPSSLYDVRSPLLTELGFNNGHPTVGAAPFGGVAIAVDSGPQSDSYFAPSFSLGYGRLGFGLLADLGAGPDSYTADRVSAGAASDTFTLGAGVLIDNGGDDSYTATTGHGYGLGGVLVDLGGRDTYRNEHEPNGLPLVKLDIIPGGNVTGVEERGNNRIWLDGPGSLSAGLGVDTEVVVTNTPSDNDNVPDFVEFLVGTDPRNTSDSPVNRPTARAEALTTDSDRDAYPDYVERALSTDPNDPVDYPAGLPSGPAIVIPAQVWGPLADAGVDSVLGQESNEFQIFDTDAGTGDALRGSDKIVDLRLPIQDAGSIEYACSGTYYPNSTAPMGLLPGDNVFGFFSISGVTSPGDPQTGGPRADDSGSFEQRCVYVAYEPGQNGEGSAAVPGLTTLSEGASGRSRFQYKLPTGILAIGDVVNTDYTSDYFVVVDLGGEDFMNNSAGGAVPVVTTPQDDGEASASETARVTFWAPTLVVNVDARDLARGAASGVTGNDTYANETRDYTQGALFGVLIDNAGADTYLARDAAQGALGGVLLDLEGTDSYTARDLAQGAGLSGIPSETPGGVEEGELPEGERDDLPSGGAGNADIVAQTPTRAHRRALPGMLLDLGTHSTQVFTAHAHAQGFARGFGQSTPGANNAPITAGILVSVGGPDVYTFSEPAEIGRGRHLQGVAGMGGVGILLDRSGTDAYRAPELVSQGATLSTSVGTQEAGPNSNPQPAFALIADLGEARDGLDQYVFAGKGSETNARQQKTTVTRSETLVTNGGHRLYADLGVRMDTTLDATDLPALVAGIGGTGSKSIDSKGFHVDLPGARLAIGDESDTTFTQEYAFAVDLGGKNTYRYTAAGFIGDVVARAGQQNNAPGAIGAFAAPLTMYPVSFLLDAGTLDSTYVAPHGLAQGAGFFSVGVLADLGGRDSFEALDTPIPSLASAWLGVRADGEDPIIPSIDATIGADWDEVPGKVIALTANDARFTSNWTIRLANTNRSLYLALNGTTTSDDDSERFADKLLIDLDIGRRHTPWDARNARTGVDQVVLSFDQGACVVQDFGIKNTTQPTNAPYGTGMNYAKDDANNGFLDATKVEVPALEAECRTTEDGQVIFEIRKDLVRTEDPFSNMDLDYCWDDDAGFGLTTRINLTDRFEYGCERPSTQLGLLIEFKDAGAGFAGTETVDRTPASFVFPAGAYRIDGGVAGVKNGNISDEMESWAAVGLANGKAGKAPSATKLPSLSQGAGVAGVGILAMLGTGHSESTLVASDRAQGYGAYGGLGMVLDVSGSDRYVGTQRVQAAGETSGVGVLIDLDGNDNYVADDKSYGWVPLSATATGHASFADLSGDDEYTWPFLNATTKVETARHLSQAGNTLAPDGNNLVWSQNSTGVGIDYRIQQIVRDIAANVVGRSIVQRADPVLSITRHAPGSPEAEHYANGCTETLVSSVKTGDDVAFSANGNVCFLASIDLAAATSVCPPRDSPAGELPSEDCVTARAGLDQLRTLAGANQAARQQIDTAERRLNESITVAAVEFSVDRERVAISFDKSRTLANGIVVYSAVVDLGLIEDGVKRAKATPIFETSFDDQHVVLFADGADNPPAADTARQIANIRTLVVDNAPGIGLGLEPAYTGRANATFSPYAYGASQQLFVNWSVTHDADEDRLEKANGWELPRTNMSFPCALGGAIPNVDQPRLCHQLAFFLPADDGPLTTAFNPNAAPTPNNLELETIGGTARYARSTDQFADAVKISTAGSFHLALPNRTAILPGSITTEIKVTLVDANGDTVKADDESEEIWIVGGGRFVGGASALPSVPALTQLFSAARPTVISGLATTRETVDSLNGNIIANQIEGVAEDCSAPAGFLQTPCAFLGGRVGTGQFQPCNAQEPVASANLPAWASWYAVQVVERGGPFRPQNPPGPLASWPIPAADAGGVPDGAICRDYTNTTLRRDVAPQGEVLAEVTGDAFDNDQLNGVLNALDPSIGNDGLNFTDFWFDTSAKTREELPESVRAKGIDIIDGTLVVPKGFRLALDFDPVPSGAGGGAVTVGKQIGEQFVGLGDTVDPALPDECEPPANVAVVCNFNLSQPADDLRDLRTTFANLDTVANEFGSLPASFFFAETGGAFDAQARFEVRVPSEQTTLVRITLDDPATGEVVMPLREEAPAGGDIVGTPTRWGPAAVTQANAATGNPCQLVSGDPGFFNACYWDEVNDGTSRGDGIVNASPVHTPRINWTNSSDASDRWTQHNLSFTEPGDLEGVFLVNVTAREAGSEVETSRVETVLIDRTGPQTRITTEPFLGTALLANGGSVPIRWSALDMSSSQPPQAGSGIKSVYVYYRVGDEPNAKGEVDDILSWEKRGPFAPGTKSLLVPGGSTTYLMMTIGEDLAGNVEGTTGESENPATLDAALAAAFKAKLANGANNIDQTGYRLVTVDVGTPRFSDYSLLGGNLREYEGSDIVFLRSQQPVSFSVCARDAETDIGDVVLHLAHVDPATGEPIDRVFTATRTGSCANEGAVYTYSGWGDVNADKTLYPEGLWAATFEVFDLGRNKINVPLGNLILDHTAPVVRVEPPVLPAGQSAVRTGDLVKIRFTGDDSFGLDLGSATVDASAFSKNVSAKSLAVRPVRVNGIIYQEAQFVVDRDNLANAAYDVVVTVPDLAGHKSVTKVPISVNTKPFDFVPGTLSVSNVTHDGFVLRWKTTDNTTSMAELGTTSIALNARTPLDPNATTEHALKVENLLPSTKYFVRAVSASTGGLKKTSEMIEVTTSTALFLEPTLPKAGDKVSGLVKVAFQGGLLDSTDFVTYTLEVRDAPAKPWTFVTTATRQGDAHELTWNSTRFLDGTAYELRITAEAGRDVTNRTIGPFTSDNTPASVLVLSPLIATNDTTPLVMAEAGDALAGLADKPAALFIDGQQVATEPTISPLTDGRIRIEQAITTPLAAGLRTFELRVEDKAGNVAKETWKVAIDGEAPILTANPTRFAPGTAAAKTGGTVTLNLTASDLSGISLVVADTSALSSVEPEVRLVKIVGTNEWQGTFGVTAAEAADTKTIAIRATDFAGNVGTMTLDVALDNVAPELGAAEVAEIRHTSARITVPSDERILITGVATAPASPTVTLSTTALAKDATLELVGLLPSRTYRYNLEVTDAAGNEVPLAGTFATLQDVKPPSGVGPLSVLDLLNGTLRLSWAEAKDDVAVDTYRVYRGEDNVTFRVVAEVKGTSYDDAGLPYEKPYVYKVAAVDYGANEGPTDGTLRAAATAVPSLSVGLVSPTIGTVSTTFRYTISYVSPGGVPAAYVRVILDGVPQNMTYVSGDATTGALYTYETRLAPHKRDEPHTYTFEASDGRYTTVFPDDGTVMRGPLVSGDALGASELAGFASFAQEVPLGGVAGLALAMIAAVGIAAVLRKKKEGSK